MTPEELAAKKAADDAAAQKAAEEAKKAGDDDAEIAAIMKDPEAVRKLRDAKRAANAEAKELRLKQEAADKAKKDQEEAALKEQNKFKELAEKKEGEVTAIKAASTKRLVDLQLRIEAQATGALDEDAVIALANRADIKVGDDFEVTGVKEAVEALKKTKPHLFGKAAKDIPPPKGGVPSPRGGFITKQTGEATSAHEDLSAGFAKK